MCQSNHKRVHEAFSYLLKFILGSSSHPPFNVVNCWIWQYDNKNHYCSVFHTADTHVPVVSFDKRPVESSKVVVLHSTAQYSSSENLMQFCHRVALNLWGTLVPSSSNHLVHHYELDCCARVRIDLAIPFVLEVVNILLTGATFNCEQTLILLSEV